MLSAQREKPAFSISFFPGKFLFESHFTQIPFLLEFTACTIKLIGLNFHMKPILFFPFFLTPCPFLPSSIILFDTFVNILSHNLGEPAYEADVAQLEYKLVAGEYGLIIRVKGFNHKLPVSSAHLLTAFMAAALQSVCAFLDLWMVGWGVLNRKIGHWQGNAANVLLFLVFTCVKMEVYELTQV